MSLFSMPAREHMNALPEVLRPDQDLDTAETLLSRLGVSALPVVDQRGSLAGVLSRTDLLRVGRVHVVNGQRRKLLSLPKRTVAQLMSATVEVALPSLPLCELARRMVRRHIHQLYVVEEDRPLGVVSMRELVRATAESRVAQPLSELMHPSIVAVQASEPLSLAIDRIALSHHPGVVVMEGGWPVGSFSQFEALLARDAAPDARVDAWMDAGFVCLPCALPAWRAAEQLAALGTERVLVVDGQAVRGIVTGHDFARLVMSAA